MIDSMWDNWRAGCVSGIAIVLFIEFVAFLAYKVLK